MKKSFKYFLLTLSALILAVLLVACGSKETLSISVSDDFQTVYVRGQELNLSEGVLKVNNGKTESEVPLSSEKVTVTGYDKTLLGEQTLTFAYEGATAEVKITVFENLTVSNATLDYLVGDELDLSRGNVKLTNHDGSTRNLPLSSDFLAISGFDSSSARSDVEIKVVCNLNGESYEGSFKINVHDIESVEFRRPNRVTYTSHYQGGVDLSGGRIILKGNGESIKREIAVTEDMVSGFDVGAVNAENSPLTQTVTVTYDGKPYTYDIQLTYTDVSTFLDNAEAFDSVDWEGDEEPTIDEELGELAIELMRSYVDMSTSEKGFLDEELVFNVARTAMVYGFDLWGENILLFKGVFAIEYGETVLYFESYDKVKNSLELFEDKDSAIYTLAPLLLDLIELYGDKVIYESETVCIRFNSYPVMDDYALSLMEGMLTHATEIYELVEDVPADWRESGLESYYDDLGKVTMQIMGASYILEYPDIYYLISDWREDSDLLDIVYNYLYETDKGAVIEKLIVFGLPTEINQLYGYIFNAVVAMDDIQNVRYADTSKIFYNYYMATDLAEKIKAQEGTVENFIYNEVPIDWLLGIESTDSIYFEVMFDYVRTAACGYRDLSAGLLGIGEYDEIMREYVYIIKNTAEIEGYVDTEEYAKSVKSVFDKFVALSPAQQYNLLSSLNYLYTLGIPELAFDDSGEYAAYSSYFSLMINNFMRSKLSAEYTETYNNLILAIEVYANRFGYDEWESDFSARMNKVEASVTTMSGTDKANFDLYLRGAYEKYMGIKANIDKTAQLGAWADDFESLRQALTDMQTAYYYMTSRDTYNYNYFLASYERAENISENILANAPQSVIDAYYHEPLFNVYLESADGEESAVAWTLDYALNMYRNFYIETLLFFGSTGVNIYDTYYEKDLDEFLSLYYDTVSAFVNKKSGQSPVFDREKMLAVLTAFCELDSETKALFVTMEGNLDLYYASLELFISEGFSGNAAKTAELLFSLEQHYYSYEVGQSAVNLNAIREILGQIKTLHDGLKGEEVASFADLEEIYDHYVESCEKLLAQ